MIQEAQLMLTNPRNALRGQWSHQTWYRSICYRYGFLVCYIVTLSLWDIQLKLYSDLETRVRVTQDHRNRHASICHRWFPINVPQ